MKKLLFFLLAVWGLVALSATARAEGETTTAPTPLSQYKPLILHNTGFVDISDEATRPEDIKVFPFGKGLDAGTELNNYYFAFDIISAALAQMQPSTGGSEGESFSAIKAKTATPKEDDSDEEPVEPDYTISKKITESDKTVGVFNFTAMQTLAYQFFGKPVNSLVVSALGGVYFTTETADLGGASTGPETLIKEDNSNNSQMPTNPTMTVPMVGDALSNIAASYGVCLYPYLDSTTLLTAKRCGGDTVPVILGYAADNDGNPYFIVQYQYSVNGKPWIFQIRCNSNGTTDLFVKDINCSMTDHLYNIALGIKRENETLLLGSTVITDQKKGIKVGTQTPLSDQVLIPLTNIDRKDSIAINQLSGINYSNVSGKVVLSKESMQTACDGKSLLIVAAPGDTPWIPFETDPIEYKVGDNLAGIWGDDYYPVVYHERPSDPTDISFEFKKLSAGKKYYLFAYWGEYDEDAESWSYEMFFTPGKADSVKTTAVPGPTGVTATIANNKAVTLTIEDTATTAKYIAIKTQYGNAPFSPRGGLSVNNKIHVSRSYFDYDEGRLVEIDPYEAIVVGNSSNSDNKKITFNLTPGERAYIIVYRKEAANSTVGYSESGVMTTVAAHANSLPLTYTFTEADLLDNQPEEAMPILPPGFGTSTEYHVSTRPAAFYVQRPVMQSEELFFLSRYDMFDEMPEEPVWSNFITPALYNADKNVQATFEAKFMTFNTMGQLTGRDLKAGDSIRIEYNINGGNWQKTDPEVFTIENMTAEADKTLPLTVFANVTAATDTVRFRYSYTTVPGEDDLDMHAVTAIELVAARNCKTPAKPVLAQDGLTDNSLKIKWTDMNTTPAPSFLVQIQEQIVSDNESGIMPLSEADGSQPNDAWVSHYVTAKELLLEDLNENTTYNIKVRATCAENDSSFFTRVTQFTTACGLPYAESLTSGDLDYETFKFATQPNVTIYYGGEPGEDLTEGTMQADWAGVMAWDLQNTLEWQTSDEPEEINGLAVGMSLDKAWLVTPSIYINKTNTLEKKTLTFKADPFKLFFNDEENPVVHGVDLEDEDVRLYVLASTTGNFTWADTVAAFNHTDLAFDTTGNITTQELSAYLDNLEGLIKIAFYFHNPNAGDNNDVFLQIADLKFDFDNSCRPVGKLACSSLSEEGVTLSWKNLGGAAKFVVAYGPANAEVSTYTKKEHTPVAGADQTLSLTGLTSNTKYKAVLTSFCSATDETGSVAKTITFTTYKKQYEVKVNILPDAQAGSVEGADVYFETDEAVLKASAKKGYKLDGFYFGTEKITTGITNDTVLKFTVTKDTTVTVKFVAVPKYNVTVSVTPEGAGSVTGANEYFEGEEVTLTATANTGYKFVGYYEGETQLSTEASYKFTASKNIAITAKFEKEKEEQGQANETQLRAEFRVSTESGKLVVTNLGGIKVKDVTVYNLAGRLLNQFAVNHSESLSLPVNAQHTIIFVRLNTEEGVAVYKVYLQ